MRVAVVFHDFHLEGSLPRERVHLARGLVGEGVEVHCYTNPETRGVEPAGVEFHDVRPIRESDGRMGYGVECGSFAWKATRLLREHRARYDVIDVAGTSAWEHDVVRVQAVPAAMQRRWPEHGGQSYRAARPRARVAHLLHPAQGVARATQRLQFRPGHYFRAVAVAELVRADLEQVHGVPSERIDVLPPPIELPRRSSNGHVNTRERFGLGKDQQILLFVGHDFERKGLGAAVEAMASVSPNAHLVVVGDGEAGAYRSAAEQAGVTGRVHFAGSTDNPEPYYSEADIFVLPTRQDVWGTAVIEAMAAGVPVVTTDVAGSAGEIRRTGAGVVIAASSRTALADAITSLLEDHAGRMRMGERGREVAARFSVTEHARVMHRIYAGVVEERAREAHS